MSKNLFILTLLCIACMIASSSKAQCAQQLVVISDNYTIAMDQPKTFTEDGIPMIIGSGNMDGVWNRPLSFLVSVNTAREINLASKKLGRDKQLVFHTTEIRGKLILVSYGIQLKPTSTACSGPVKVTVEDGPKGMLYEKESQEKHYNKSPLN